MSKVPSPSRQDATVVVDRAKPAVKIDALSKRYGSTIALDDVSFTVQQGTIYGILGPNGAGKSTLLRTIVGLVRPDSGSASTYGLSAGSKESLSLIGTLVERPAFVPSLSGRENLEILAAARGISMVRVQEVLATMGLSDRQTGAYKTYSLGMGQRLGIAAALLPKPKLLILDEPTSGLDPDGVVLVRRIMSEYAASGATVIFSSHILFEVEKLCEQVVLLQSGSVIAAGELKDIIEKWSKESVTLTASPAIAARDYLVGRELISSDLSIPDDYTWTLLIPVDGIPELVRDLAVAGIDVLRVEQTSFSLEEVFLAIVNSEDER